MPIMSVNNPHDIIAAPLAEQPFSEDYVPDIRLELNAPNIIVNFKNIKTLQFTGDKNRTIPDLIYDYLKKNEKKFSLEESVVALRAIPQISYIDEDTKQILTTYEVFPKSDIKYAEYSPPEKKIIMMGVDEYDDDELTYNILFNNYYKINMKYQFESHSTPHIGKGLIISKNEVKQVIWRPLIYDTKKYTQSSIAQSKNPIEVIVNNLNKPELAINNNVIIVAQKSIRENLVPKLKKLDYKIINDKICITNDYTVYVMCINT